MTRAERMLRNRRDRVPGNGRVKSREAKDKALLAMRLKKCPVIPRQAGSSCELCAKPFNEKRRPHLDHCHLSSKFRGWLCSRCNTGLGKFDDTIEGLERAIAYLRVAGKE